MKSVTLSLPTAAATADLAAHLATHLRRGDVVCLDGPLAAGKTTLTVALARALGVEGDVTSPTYTIAAIHPCAKGTLLHVDAYRLENAREFHNLGLEDYIDDGITVVEWASRLGEAFDAPLHITLSLGDTDSARVAHLSADDARWWPVLEALA